MWIILICYWLLCSVVACCEEIKEIKEEDGEFTVDDLGLLVVPFALGPVCVLSLFCDEISPDVREVKKTVLWKRKENEKL